MSSENDPRLQGDDPDGSISCGIAINPKGDRWEVIITKPGGEKEVKIIQPDEDGNASWSSMELEELDE